jgi:hypothetical protein
MVIVDFYSNLHCDFSDYENKEEFFGLATGGFNGKGPLRIKDFNELELNATRDVIACFLRPIGHV